MHIHANRKAQLTKRLHELNVRLEEIETTLNAKPNRDDEDRASETEDNEVIENLGLTAQKEIEMITAALARIDDETYGICANCGDPIKPERLDLLPYTPLCKDCAR